jgi:hypothetical protein
MFAFGAGLHEENDQRLQNPGTPRQIANLVRVKNGRLSARRDYETLAMTLNSGQTGLQLHDLLPYDGRVFGVGSFLSGIYEATPQRGATALIELVEQPGFAWRPTNQSAFSPATQVRHVGTLGKQATSVSVSDVAAGLGLVCCVFDVTLVAGGLRTAVHIFNADTNATVFFTEFSSRRSPRVVFCGSAFFITLVITATGEIELYSFTPSTSAFVQLTSPVSAGAAVDAYDLALSYEGTTFWMAVARAGATTVLRGMNSAGTVTYAVAGPAVLYDSISILVHSTVAATQRLHILGVRDTTGTMDLVTYLPPAGAPATTTNNIFTPNVSVKQASLAVRDLASGTTEIVGIYETNSAVLGGNMSLVQWQPINAVTHALGVGEVRTGKLTSKIRNVNSLLAFGMSMIEGTGQETACLAHIFRSFRFLARPVTVVDRLLAGAPSAFHLPSLCTDASTGLSYWGHLTKTVDGNSQPRVTEFKANATDRRQSVEIGGSLYIAGGVLHVFDARCLGEAGGFLIRPSIIGAVGNNSGALNLSGVYQFTLKFEMNDSLDRRVQSAVSELVEITLSAIQDQVDLTGYGVFSYWDATEADSTPNTQRAQPFIVTYRTLDTLAGNITFHLDLSSAMNAPWSGIVNGLTSVQSDVSLSDNEIIYTQGARGQLSGPLDFVTPDPAITLAASSDRVMTGGLPRDSAFQESRPLLIGEQVQWSDSFAFYRDVRGRILAVARLDERRILFTASEIFECDGPGIDDNGLGDIGSPRRLPSDVGLYGGRLGWRSLVEMSAGILFQGARDQIYLLPRGGVTPIAIGGAVEDTLDLYPVISAAVYIASDQTVRFFCNNEAGTESVVLLLDVRFNEWFFEGPYAFTFRAATKQGDRLMLLTSLNTVLRQRTQTTPLAFVANSWRSGVIHPWKAGMFGRIDAVWFYGTVRGNCRIRCIVQYDEQDTETHEWVEVFNRTAGSQFRYRFGFDQLKCESVKVDFEIVDFQGEATAGLDYTYWAIEGEASGVPNEVGPEEMT